MKAGWEWTAVLGQVEFQGWTRLEVRCCSSEVGERCLAMNGAGLREGARALIIFVIIIIVIIIIIIIDILFIMIERA